MADAIFGSPARRPFQDKKTALTKNEILKITLERKEGVNGMHFLQLGFGKMAALPRVDNICVFSRRLLALKVLWKPPPRQALFRWLQVWDMCRPEIG